MLTHLKTFFTHRQSLATGSGFFILGFLFGNWATLIPYVKDLYALDDALLGLMLLCLPLGAMIFNPIAAMAVRRFGFQRMTVVGMILVSIVYALPVCVGNFYALPVSLLLVGIGMTILNISVNTTATAIEQKENISIMATCHGMFSVGLMVGALMRSMTLLAGLSEFWHMIGMCAIAMILAYVSSKTLLSIENVSNSGDVKKSAPKGSFIPRGALLTIIGISICTNVTEGSMTDWASLYMKEVVRTSPYFVGWGLFGYSAFMALGRFFGDGIIPRLGRNRVLAYGGALSGLGLTMIILFPVTVVAILGFACIGLGVSCGAPILYASASRYPGLPDAGGLAMMNTYAMGGFLMGPAIIGFISDQTSLKTAFGFVAVLTLIWMYKSHKAELY